ncbi:MAG: amidohydrolase family protein [Beijerinckiaceae bacterium]|jgi:predicted TIM-barrel fold metal-dependent hydrolase|nr:amidohydrolase family protein [Beijerinckiaceae bacterium]
MSAAPHVRPAAPLVDCHAHIYTRAMPASDTAWHLPPHDATIEDYVATLDAHGVHFAVLAAASIYGDYNDYAIEAVRRNRRLRTTVIVDAGVDAYTMRRMQDDGVVGIRFQFRNVASPPDLRSFEYRRLMRRAADLGWHVHLHDEGPRLAQFIEPILEAGPRLVIDHFGRPNPAQGAASPEFEAVLRALDGGRAWVKISAAFRLEPQGAAQDLTARLLAHGGTERLLWGSDWPFAAFEDRVTYGDVLAAFAANVPDDAQRREIDRTALKFYFS